MWILPLLGYVGLALGFAFMTLSIASGLYYLSELVEEHTVLSSKLLTRLIYAVIAVQILLWLIDGFPFTLTCLGVVSHIVYASNLRYFPIVKFSDPLFLLNCALVGLNHWVWFRHFSEAPPYESRSAYRDLYQSAAPQPSFTEISSYFGIYVWLVPFAFFVSLSAGKNVLLSMGSEYATGSRAGIGAKGHKRRNTGMAKAAVNNVKEWVGETGAVMGMWQKDNDGQFFH
jgi:hypothetical protein